MGNMLADKSKTGSYAPNYYGNFKCIAGKCRHSCCIDWEIRIDEETYEKYKKLEEIIDTVTTCEDGPCFELCEDGRCPHLNDVGLCNIILAHGEELLSEICKNHPRFFNEVGHGRIEAGLGIVCEEACRLILEDESGFELTKIEEVRDAELSGSDERDFDALSYRDRIIARLDDAAIGFDAKLDKIKTEYAIPKLYEPDEWLERFLALEILDDDWERDLRELSGKLFCVSDEVSEKYGKYLERLLKYFVYRHVSIAADLDNLRARLGFSILSVEVIRSLFEASTERSTERLIDLARRYSAEIEYSEDNTDELIFIFESGV